MANEQGGFGEMYLTASGAGEAVLFLHGIPTSSQLWSGVIERMAGRFRCLAVDLPGLGRTAGAAGGLRDLDAVVASLEALRVRSGIERWHLVGHDAGCAIAVRYAHRHAERVGRLALLTPSIFPDLKPFWLFELLRKPILGELTAPAVNLLFWKLVMQRALGRGASNTAAVREFSSPFHGLPGAWRLMSLLRWGKPAEVLAKVPEQLAELAMPTVIFHGLRDRAVPERFATLAAALIPNAEKVLLDCGHFLPMSAPEAVAGKLSSFLSAEAERPLARAAFAIAPMASLASVAV
jgi:pimeloyl-ACP methyl ester carboxylesterase